jgi:hypothetical protein
MDLESLKLVLLGGVREELMENLNLLENGDIFHLSYEKINKVFKNYSKDGSKNNRDCGCVVAHSLMEATTNLTKYEIGTLLEDMNTNILHSLAIQLDNMQIKRK